MAKCFVSAGGTGGHIFPAMAVARCLQNYGIEVNWVGSRGRLEERIVPQHFPIHYLSIKALRGKGKLSLLAAPWRIVQSTTQAVKLIRLHKPKFILAMGGYVCGPLGVAAWLMRVPLILHEQNAAAGLTNRWLAKIATKVFQAFPNSFPSDNQSITVVGNPVRESFWQLAKPEQRLAVNQPKLRVLIVGGSQGARFINQRVPDVLSKVAQSVGIDVWHQTGEHDLSDVELAYHEHELPAKVTAFINDMSSAYAWADVLICRAGALTVSEVAAAGVAAVFVPLPIAVDDHQRKNAEVLVQAGAAQIMSQANWSEDQLITWLVGWQRDRTQLITMAQAATAVAKPSATEDVAAACIELIEGNNIAVKE